MRFIRKGIGEASIHGAAPINWVGKTDMKYRQILMMACTLSLIAAIGTVQAGELNDYLDEVSTAQIGTNNTNTVPDAAPTRRSAQRLLTMVGGRWLKSLTGIDSTAEEKQEVSFADALRASEYDLRMNEEDVMVSLTYRF